MGGGGSWDYRGILGIWLSGYRWVGGGKEEEEVGGWERSENRKRREEGKVGHRILEDSWGLGCGGIGGWRYEEEEE